MDLNQEPTSPDSESTTRLPSAAAAKAVARALLESSGAHPIVRDFPAGVVVVFDHNMRYICAGGHGLSLVGLTQEMIEGKTIYQVFPPEVSSVLKDPYHRALEGHEETIDIRFDDRTYLHRMAPLTDTTGAIVAGIGFAFDVTEARLAEEELRTTAEDLRQEQRRLREAEEIGNAGSWEWDVVNDVITWSEGLFTLHHLDPTDFEGGYQQAASRVHPDDRALVDQAMESMRRNEPVNFRYRIFRASDGEERWFDSRGSAVFEDGQLVRLIGAVADVTDQVHAQAEVIQANAFQRAVIAASPDYTFISNLHTGAFVYESRDRDLLGRTIDETEALASDAARTIVHPDDLPTLSAINEAAARMQDGQVLQVRYRLRHVDGTWRWFSRHVVPFRREADGSVVEVLGVLRDITDVVEAEEQLTHDALHDSLTGLPNRALLMDRLESALSRSVREAAEIAVLYCDLDGFKRVNDTVGHAAGDAVLIETARRLQSVVRVEDTIARVGGDEFVIILEPWSRHDSDKEGSADGLGAAGVRKLTPSVAHRIVDALRAPYEVLGTVHEISVSIGITYPSTMSADLTADSVMRTADAAMYEAKHQGKNQFSISIPGQGSG